MELTKQSVQAEIETLDKRIERLQSKLTEARNLRDALRLTAEHFSPPEPKPRRKSAMLRVDVDMLRGMELDNALVFLADRNDGHVISGPARELLVEAGILRGKSTTTSHALCRALAESPRFEREAPGRYRLLDDASPAEVEADVNGRHPALGNDPRGHRREFSVS